MEANPTKVEIVLHWEHEVPTDSFVRKMFRKMFGQKRHILSLNNINDFKLTQAQDLKKEYDGDKLKCIKATGWSVSLTAKGKSDE